MRAGRAPGSGRPAASRGSRVSWPFPYRLLVCVESLGRLTRPVKPQVRGEGACGCGRAGGPGSGRPAAARGSRVRWPFPYRLLVCGESLGGCCGGACRDRVSDQLPAMHLGEEGCQAQVVKKSTFSCAPPGPLCAQVMPCTCRGGTRGTRSVRQTHACAGRVRTLKRSRVGPMDGSGTSSGVLCSGIAFFGLDISIVSELIGFLGDL